MAHPVLQLYPPPLREHPLEGSFLAHDLRQVAQEMERPLFYTNFIVSLDGRIAVPDPEGKGVTLATAITNPRDWRLFQELAVQADVLITTGRYLREYAQGAAQEILQAYDDPAFSDLRAWRQERNLAPYPALAVISGSLQFPVPQALRGDDREVLVFTTERADKARLAALEQAGAQVIAAGEERVQGHLLAAALAARGKRVVYSTAGPKVHHLLLSAGLIERLYLSYAPRALGGEPFATIVQGPLLEPPVDFRLLELHFDPHGLQGLGQLFAVYQRAASPR
jgi:riboflavin biosynthesis pyrimidine reductase